MHAELEQILGRQIERRVIDRHIDFGFANAMHFLHQLLNSLPQAWIAGIGNTECHGQIGRRQGNQVHPVQRRDGFNFTNATQIFRHRG